MNSRKTIVNILSHWKKENKIIDFILEKELKSVDHREKQFIQYVVLGVIENLMSLEFILNKITDRKYKKNQLEVKIILLCGTYELLYSSQKKYAIINEYVTITKKTASVFYSKIVNAILRKVDSKSLDIIKELELTESINIKYNIPTELHTLLNKHYKTDELISWYESLKKKNTIWVRKKELLSDIKVNRFSKVEEFKDIKKGLELGECSVQDISAGKVIEYMKPKKESKILDYCAAPGSKTTYIAELTEDKAEIIATDINDFRMAKIDESIKRLHLKSIKTEEIKDVLNKKSYFDQILLDVPCSGSGTLSKNSDIKYKITQEKITELNLIQKEIIELVLPLLKKNGELIYSTCSILPEENELLINKVLKNTLSLIVEEKSKTILPFDGNHDGAFMIKLKKIKD